MSYSTLGSWWGPLLGPITLLPDMLKSLQNIPGEIKKLFGTAPMTAADIRTKAFELFSSGKISYQDYMSIIRETTAEEEAKGKSSGLAQFGNILKWVAIIGGIGLGAYLLAPTIRKAVALIPIPEPKSA